MHSPPDSAVISGTQSAQWDADSIALFRETGVPNGGLLLMSWAARAAVQWYREKFPQPHQHCEFLCGRGNNGGDGFAIAWFMAQEFPEMELSVFAAGKPHSDEANFFYELIKKDSKIILTSLIEYSPSFNRDTAVWEGLYGTGFSGKTDTNIENLFLRLKESESTKIAIDIAGGVPASGNFFEHSAFPADYTLAFGAAKIGMLTEPGIFYSGLIEILPIGFVRRPFPNRLLRPVLPQPLRKPDGHKYTSGTLFFFGGSPGMEGAAVMASRAFLESGGGLAKVYSTSENTADILRDIPEAMVNRIHDADDFISAAESVAAQSAKAKSVVVIGPGFAESPPDPFWNILCNNSRITLIADASALALLPGIAHCKEHSLSTLLLTPHAGERRLLLAQSNGNSYLDAMAIAKQYRAVVYAKGPGGILTDGLHSIFVNSREYQLSTGGTGDILSGLMASMALRFSSGLEIAEAAVSLYLQAANRAVSANPEFSLSARDKFRSTDILRYL